MKKNIPLISEVVEGKGHVNVGSLVVVGAILIGMLSREHPCKGAVVFLLALLCKLLSCVSGFVFSSWHPKRIAATVYW